MAAVVSSTVSVTVPSAPSSEATVASAVFTATTPRLPSTYHESVERGPKNSVVVMISSEVSSR